MTFGLGSGFGPIWQQHPSLALLGRENRNSPERQPPSLYSETKKDGKYRVGMARAPARQVLNEVRWEEEPGAKDKQSCVVVSLQSLAGCRRELRERRG